MCIESLIRYSISLYQLMCHRHEYIIKLIAPNVWSLTNTEWSLIFDFVFFASWLFNKIKVFNYILPNCSIIEFRKKYSKLIFHLCASQILYIWIYCECLKFCLPIFNVKRIRTWTTSILGIWTQIRRSSTKSHWCPKSSNRWRWRR